MARLFWLLPLIALLAASCMQSRESYIESAYPGKFPTSYGSTVTTPLGVRVAGTTDPADLEKADFIIQTVYECVRRNFPTGKVPYSGCFDNEVSYPPFRDLVVVIGEWEMSCDGKQQLLTVDAPASGCRAKGRIPTPECPCRWRGGFRESDHGWFQHGDHMHIVTKSLFMLSDTLTRYVTGCWNPWAGKPLAKECASPKVPILPA